MLTSRWVLPVVLTLGSLNAQNQADATEYGLGGPGALPFSPPLGFSATPPVLGQPMFMDLVGGPPGGAGVALIARTDPNGIPVPLLPFLPDNSVYVDLGALLPIRPLPPLDPLGSSQLLLPIPPDPSLSGLMFSTQAVVLDPDVPFGLRTSNGVMLGVGDFPAPPRDFQTATFPLPPPIPIPPDPFVSQFANSPLTQDFLNTLALQGQGIDFGLIQELFVDGPGLPPMPLDVRIGFAPVVDLASGQPLSSIYMFTNGTHPTLGFIEGADVMEFVPGGGILGESSIRVHTDPNDFSAYAEISMDAGGSAVDVDTSGPLSPYLQCLGAALAGKVAVGTLSGLSAACGAACTACLVPNPTTPPACGVCLVCVIASGAAVVGCWWAC